MIFGERTDFDADAFFFFGGRACAGTRTRARALVSGGGYLGYVGLARHGERFGTWEDSVGEVEARMSDWEVLVAIVFMGIYW